MNQTLRRVFVMLCAGAGVWILVFWLYQPADPMVTYGGAPVRSGTSSLVQLDTVAQGPSEPEGFEGAPVGGPTEPAPEPQGAVAPGGAGPGAGAGEPAGPTLVARVVAPEFWEYTVQRGDSSWEVIAAKTLGDRRLAPAVLRANPLVSPDKLVPGRTRLKIPRDPKNIQGLVVHEPAGPGPAPGAGAPAGGAAREHTVAKGETLSQIAQRHLGSAAKWREIYEANRAVISDPDRLKPGTVLTIPGG